MICKAAGAEQSCSERLFCAISDNKDVQVSSKKVNHRQDPGKKLNFMGNELAMFREWDERREPDWDLLQYPAHADFHNFMVRLNRLYLEEQALWEADDAAEGFRW